MCTAPPPGRTDAPLAGGSSLPRLEPLARLPVPVRAVERGRAPALRDAAGPAADVRGAAAAAPRFAAHVGVTELCSFSSVIKLDQCFFNHCASGVP